MTTTFRELDRILRGEATRLEALRDGTIHVPFRELSLLLAGLGGTYGFFMGWFALSHGDGPWRQVLASIVKVPALFALTLAVTLPSLYVFNALVGSRLTLTSVLRLMLAAAAVILAVLASLGTVVGFFSLTTLSSTMNE